MQSPKIKKFRKMLAEAPNYEVWKAAALELDYLEGHVDWKESFVSDLYDYELIYERLSQLRLYHQQKDHDQLRRALREGLHHDLGNMGNPRLFERSHVGTKHLIEEYVNQVCESLNYLCDQDIPDFSLSDKLTFFKDTLLSYGRPALLLSGGATLGLFHIGVIKALWERGLLPQVVNGSSIGAIVAGMLGTTTDAEMPSLFDPESHNLRAWRWMGVLNGLRGRGFMDQSQLEACLRTNIGEYSFEEAFERTGRAINITVSPVHENQKARLLCGYTAPYLLVWSAALASAAVPGIFPPVKLMKKDRSGSLIPYMPKQRWVDGSVVSDLPIERLMHLYDVNFTLVSQTNPHVVPFLRSSGRDEKRGLMSLPGHLVKEEISFHGRGLFDFLRKRARPEILRQASGHMYTILAQRYYGDVTIAPRYSLAHYARMLSNPTPEFARQLILEGERATWPRISMIRAHAKISQTLERCVDRCKERRERRRAEIRVIA